MKFNLTIPPEANPTVTSISCFEAIAILHHAAHLSLMQSKTMIENNFPGQTVTTEEFGLFLKALNSSRACSYIDDSAVARANRLRASIADLEGRIMAAGFALHENEDADACEEPLWVYDLRATIESMRNASAICKAIAK